MTTIIDVATNGSKTTDTVEPETDTTPTPVIDAATLADLLEIEVPAEANDVALSVVVRAALDTILVSANRLPLANQVKMAKELGVYSVNLDRESLKLAIDAAIVAKMSTIDGAKRAMIKPRALVRLPDESHWNIKSIKGDGGLNAPKTIVVMTFAGASRRPPLRVSLWRFADYTVVG